MAAQLSGAVPSTLTISAGRQPRPQSLEWGADYGNDTTVAIRHRMPLRELRVPAAGIEVLLQAGALGSRPHNIYCQAQLGSGANLATRAAF